MWSEHVQEQAQNPKAVDEATGGLRCKKFSWNESDFLMLKNHNSRDTNFILLRGPEWWKSANEVNINDCIRC